LDRRAFLRTSAALACAALASATAPVRAETLADLVDAAQTPADGLFGSLEFTSASLSALPQWEEIQARMETEGPAFATCTDEAARCASAPQRSWRKLQHAARPLARAEQLHAVNRFFNRWPYKTDREVYGLSEVWASPTEFMIRSGDCEDFAIAKYFALRQLGFRSEELRIVVLYDNIRNIGHAVLAVYEPNEILILDSLSDFIASHRRYRHYIPQYSMNETTRWAHVDATRAIPRTAFRTTGQ
jgi:predicted transglutaminase-like cysteine proteinase